MAKKTYSQTVEEETANALTHGIGLLLALIGMPVLLAMSVQYQHAPQIIGVVVFGFSIFLVYAVSTVYHAVSHPWVKRRLRVADHICIYFLIGGSHTPFVLLYLNNAFGWTFLAILWGLILLGILYKLFFFGQYPWLSLVFYIFLGWTAIFTIPYMMETMSLICLYWIIAGGLCYTLGTIFYSWETLNYHHAIWHLFVIGGSTGHYVALLIAIKN